MCVYVIWKLRIVNIYIQVITCTFRFRIIIAYNRT